MKKILSLTIALILIFGATPVFADTDDSYVNVGNMIADSYIYEAKINRMHDIDVAITTCTDENALNDDLYAFYLTGRDLRHIAEMDVSLGDKYPELHLSYSGLRLQYNPNRVKMDRLTDLSLYDEFGINETSEIESGQLYKIIADESTMNQLVQASVYTNNMYKVSLKDGEGNSIDLPEPFTLTNGVNATQAQAMADYMDFTDGIPSEYKGENLRKIEININDFESKIENPGFATWLVIIAVILIAVIVIIGLNLLYSVVLKISPRKKS